MRRKKVLVVMLPLIFFSLIGTSYLYRQPQLLSFKGYPTLRYPFAAPSPASASPLPSVTDAPAPQFVRYSPESPTSAVWSTKEASVEIMRRNENIFLENNLGWTFGGKAQRGWSIYLPLICHTINAEHSRVRLPQSDFANRLIVWQTAHQLPASGVLDEATWQAMVAAWQSNRLKDKTTGELVQVPATEFWDLERAPELRMVERATYGAYKQLVRAAIADKSLNLRHTPDGELSISEPRLKIISAYRSPEYQAQLRRQSPNSGRAGLAVNSPHFSGRALDLYVGGDPVDTKFENRALQTSTPVYRWLVANAHRFGFRPYFYEPWHWEYVGESD